ncbi:hypothetical protein TREMEDRAFT_25037 [Tremella mesenterica DSM 1558]|uniref:uncharacterized protein n=1 Tax=Tremella mesenterica (strain ATCC 24925 / CBS 8224 / DSM 1558 / NBRC 9311 / NRRL Y-6157 / RJB 2259-6 / UBC 559-6) TaxID=578456 RepID=UPI0003F49E29|nr:uncharacterized protein TREMEDRAFT_25037 [Tremella mesenterica DSM 1558]EIW72945.1 hypothetical protein TREMEDRAFT_25037 [Tremella mesenterica DSM 1558]
MSVDLEQDSPQAERFRRNQQEFQAYLPLTERVQQAVHQDADELRAQEGWDRITQLGVDEWLDDQSSIYRALRRNRYDPVKAQDFLFQVLQTRISRSLHGRIPDYPPYSQSSLFYILPLPKFTDRLNRPVAVLTLKQVVRDGDGRLDDLKAMVWWALEMIRRTLRDWWTKDIFQSTDKGKEKRRRRGAEGCVLLVDAAGAGYRNLEVELLPTLLSVGHNNFPGMFEGVFVVNAGWTHRSMWSVIKRVLPRSALDKILFLDGPARTEEIFDLDRLPTLYGGRAVYAFNPSNNPILERYSTCAAYEQDSVIPPQRSASCSTIADVYHTAQNSPAQSRSASRRQSMSTGHVPLLNKLRISQCPKSELEAGESSISQGSSELSSSSHPDAPTTPVKSHVSRIKSLTDFHLYLSPSRLANIDILTDSDADDIPPLPKPKKALRPAMLEPNIRERLQDLASRRDRPPLRLQGISGQPSTRGGQVRTYSDFLQRHHAQAMSKYNTSPSHLRTSSSAPPNKSSSQQSFSSLTIGGTPPVGSDPAGQSVVGQEVPAFANSNPWFGYPAVRVPDPDRPGHTTLRPRYSRNRKRDLLKTLLFLFLLRLQSWRDSLERFIGLDRLGLWSVGRRELLAPARNPSEGLIQDARRRAALSRGEIVHAKEKDWVWMIVTFLLLRGTWMKLLTTPLEMLGLESVKNIFGLI